MASVEHVSAHDQRATVLTRARCAIVEIELRDRCGVVVAVAVVDAIDARHAEVNWCLSDAGYVVRNVQVGPKRDNRTRQYRLHREILGLVHGDGLKADHVDRNPLNNRRSNLRITTAQGNAENKGSLPGSTSRYRGVVWAPWANRWRAQCKMAGKNHHLGYFEREEDAAETASAFRRARMPMAVE